jgi:hypothetical protein
MLACCSGVKFVVELQLRVVVELFQILVLSFMPAIRGVPCAEYTESVHPVVRKARIFGLLTLSLKQKTFPCQEF